MIHASFLRFENTHEHVGREVIAKINNAVLHPD